MGLDMYLYRKSWVDNSEWIKPEYRAEIKMTKGGKEVDTSNIRYIVEEVGYWRKANAIHRWFVENVQNGEDDCGEYTVTAEQLKELRDLCAKAKYTMEMGDHSVAQKELPTQSGFFFGDTGYGEYYIEDLKSTIEICDRALSDPNSQLTYSSSW
jgi:hypothetical protein